MQSTGRVQHSTQTTVKSPAVSQVVLLLMNLTEVAQLCFQEEVVEAKIQGVAVDSEDKISLEKDFLLWDNQSSPVSITLTTSLLLPPMLLLLSPDPPN